MVFLKSLKSFAWYLLVEPFVFAFDSLVRREPVAELRPIAQLILIDRNSGLWESSGGDPQFIVSGRMPRRWARLTVSVQDRSGHGPTARLYFDRGSGWSEADSLELPADGRENRVWLFCGDIGRLRLDPASHDGRFSVDAFRLQAVPGVYVGFRQWLDARRAESPTEPLPAVASGPPPRSPYDSWLEVNRWNSRRRTLLEARLEQMQSRPVISVVMPVYNPPLTFLIKAVESVRGQVYTQWELCIADDHSADVNVRKYLQDLSLGDSRIKVYFRGENGNISRASNDAAALASGEFVAFLDQDDEITPDALGEMALYLDQHPDTDYLYSDDDKIDVGDRRFDPQFKPDWSPELLLSYMYMSHLVVLRRKLFAGVGGFRVGFEGSQDYDLALRVTEQARAVGHIPKILYHWRVLPGSTALSGAEKSGSFDAGRRAVREACSRRNAGAEAVQPDWAVEARCGIFTLEFADDGPSVAVLIPAAAGVDRLTACLRSLEKTSYRNFKVFVLHDSGDGHDTQTLLTLEGIPREVLCLPADGMAGGLASLYNRAAEQIDAEYLLFMSGELEVVSPRWLGQMAGYLGLNGVGAVGARLLSARGDLHHVGLIHGASGSAAAAPFRGRPASDLRYLAYTHVARNYSACSGACLIVRREAFADAGRFDEVHLEAAHYDVDLCYRMCDRRLRVVYCPTAVLTVQTDNGLRPDTELDAELNFGRRYRYRRDPYYNVNLSLADELFSIAGRAPRPGPVGGPIRTLMVSHNLGLEGAPSSQLELTAGLMRMGVIEPVVVSAAAGPLRAAYEALGIRVEIVPAAGANGNDPSTYQSRVTGLSEWIRGTGASVVYANTRVTFPVVHAAKLANIPSIWNLRESEPLAHYFDEFGADVAVDALKCLHYPYQNVYVARSTMESCRPFHTHNNVTTIHNGLDRKRFDDELRKHPRSTTRVQLGIGSDEIAVLTLGTVCARKGQADLIEAAACLPDALLRKIRFLIVGDRAGAYSDHVRSRAAEASALRQINLSIVPETHDAAMYYSAADIFVCTSRVESYPRVILEAMAAGLPIVTTPVFGIQEQVRAEVNGLFYEPGAVGVLAGHLARLTGDCELMTRMGRNSLLVLDTLVDYETMLQEYATIFQEAWLSGCSR